MPRARNIKPAFLTNDELGDLEPLARLLFIGMWIIADYKGDFEWRPKKVKAQILPYDECDVVNLAINLDKSGFIRFYSDQGKIYCRVVNFSAHQNPHKNEREKGSDIPEYDENTRQVIDFTTITINHDLSGLKRNSSTSDRADSLSLNPDSLSLNPVAESKIPVSAYKDMFTVFWKAYPKKQGKAEAEKSWLKLKPDQALFDLIFSKLELFKTSNEWTKDGGQFIPNASTWINQKRWDDELTYGGIDNGQNRLKQNIRETPLERMARKQKAMELRQSAPFNNGEILAADDTIVSTQMGIDRGRSLK